MSTILWLVIAPCVALAAWRLGAWTSDAMARLEMRKFLEKYPHFREGPPRCR